MSIQGSDHRSAAQSAVGLNVIPITNRGPLIKITKSRHLFVWIWKQLAASEPKIAVSAHIDASQDYFFRTIRAGRRFEDHLEWRVIFEQIPWESVYDRSKDQCAVLLLGFIGKLTNLLLEEREARVPQVRACEMMLEYWDRRGTYIGYDNKRGQTFLISTPACELKYGVKIRVKMDDVPLDDLVWTLRGKPDSP